MANILKRIRKSSRHEKLLEDPQSIEDPVVDGVTFLVKYLGDCEVENDSGEKETATAIKNTITKAKKENSKLTRVSLTISEKGVKMVNNTTKEVMMDISIYNISYCTADPTFDHVFAFICHSQGSDQQGTFSCHTFLCPKKKMATAATLTIAHGFSLAYHNWQDTHVGEERHNKQDKILGRGEDNTGEKEEDKDSNVVVTEAVVEKLPDNPNDKTASPPPGPSKHSEELLIDWNHQDSCSKPWEEFKQFEEPQSRSSKWINFDESETQDMNSKFERLALGNTSIKILDQLPLNSSSLNFGAFACSPSISDYAGSPNFGLSLTPSQLMTPVGSPYHNPFQAGSPSSSPGINMNSSPSLNSINMMNTFPTQLSPPAGSPARGFQHTWTNTRNK